MKCCVIYDSQYGNTEKIAQAIARALASQEKVLIRKAGEALSSSLEGVELLVVGSPTQRFSTLIGVSEFLNGISPGSLKGVKVAAFDTRLTIQKINSTPVLGFFVKRAGAKAYAAKHIADALTKKGGELVAEPEGFFVKDTEGPLVEGELERAEDWAKKLVTA